MIVICTKCKAKFRVADDRIGPRGANVRCSRCHTTFHVTPRAAPPPEAFPAAPPPAAPPDRTQVDLENPFGGASAAAEAAPSEADPFAAAGFGSAVASPPPIPSRSDPFAAAYVSESPSPSDPFAAAAPAPHDPFAARADADPFAAPLSDDFDFAQPAAPPAATHLSDLLGSTGAAELAAAPEPRPEPESIEPAPLAPPALDDGGLALEERNTPPPLPVAAERPPLEPGGGLGAAQPADGFAMGGDADAFEPYHLGSSGTGPALALATETPAARPSPPAPEPAPAAPAIPVAPAPARAGVAVVASEAAHAEEGMPGARPSRLRAAVLNAVALAALLAVTLAILVVWRSEGGPEGLSLRPAAVLAALGGGGAATPFSAVDVRSGVYEREKGPPLLFVRGKVVSRAPGAVRSVKVLVEVMRADGVLARGEALAGAVPTPEELYQVGDGPAFAALARAAAARAPAEIRPGDAVPFLVAIADAPADLDGVSVRVQVASAGARSP